MRTDASALASSQDLYIPHYLRRFYPHFSWSSLLFLHSRALARFSFFSESARQTFYCDCCCCCCCRCRCCCCWLETWVFFTMSTFDWILFVFFFSLPLSTSICVCSECFRSPFPRSWMHHCTHDHLYFCFIFSNECTVITRLNCSSGRKTWQNVCVRKEMKGEQERLVFFLILLLSSQSFEKKNSKDFCLRGFERKWDKKNGKQNHICWTFKSSFNWTPNIQL